jgi:hypothetical protein
MPGGRPPENKRGEGCYVNNRCDHPECKAAFAGAQRARNHARRYGKGCPQGPDWQAAVLADLTNTGNLKVTAANLGTTWQAIGGARKSLPEFDNAVAAILGA